jgi:hypothetical protein
MPVWLRKFTFETLKEYFEKQKEESENQQNMLTNKGKNEISRPNIAPKQPPTYITKAPKK